LLSDVRQRFLYRITEPLPARALNSNQNQR
jgi:hypothetical protein